MWSEFFPAHCQVALPHLAMQVGFEPTTSGSHVLRTGSRTKINNTRRMVGQSSRLWKTRAGRDSNSLVANVLRTGSRAWFKRPTKFWSETYGALPLSYSATLGDLRWWDSNPRPPAYEACTPNRQSVLYRWPGDEVVVRPLLYPAELHPPFDCRVDDRIRTDNRCMPTGSRRGQFQKHPTKVSRESGIAVVQPPASVHKERPSARCPRLGEIRTAVTSSVTQASLP